MFYEARTKEPTQACTCECHGRPLGGYHGLLQSCALKGSNSIVWLESFIAHGCFFACHNWGYTPSLKMATWVNCFYCMGVYSVLSDIVIQCQSMWCQNAEHEKEKIVFK